MNIRRWLCYVLISCAFVLTYIDAKTYSRTEESKLKKYYKLNGPVQKTVKRNDLINFMTTSNRKSYQQIPKRFKVGINNTSLLQRYYSMNIQPKLSLISQNKTKEIKKPEKNTSAVEYTQGFQIKAPLKTKTLNLFSSGNTQTVRKIRNNVKQKKRIVPFINSHHKSSNVTSKFSEYGKNKYGSIKIIKQHDDKKRYRGPTYVIKYKKTGPAQKTIATPTNSAINTIIQPLETKVQSTYTTASRNESGIRSHKILPPLHTRDTNSFRRYHYALNERNSSTILPITEGHNTGNLTYNRYNTKFGQNSTKDSGKDSYSYPRDSSKNDKFPERTIKFGRHLRNSIARNNIANENSETPENKYKFTSNTFRFKKSNGFKTGGNKTENSTNLPRIFKHFRGLSTEIQYKGTSTIQPQNNYEESSNHVKHIVPSNKPFLKGNGPTTKKIEAICGENKGVTEINSNYDKNNLIKDDNISDYRSNNNVKSKDSTSDESLFRCICSSTLPVKELSQKTLGIRTGIFELIHKKYRKTNKLAMSQPVETKRYTVVENDTCTTENIIATQNINDIDIITSKDKTVFKDNNTFTKKITVIQEKYETSTKPNNYELGDNMATSIESVIKVNGTSTKKNPEENKIRVIVQNKSIHKPEPRTYPRSSTEFLETDRDYIIEEYTETPDSEYKSNNRFDTGEYKTKRTIQPQIYHEESSNHDVFSNISIHEENTTSSKEIKTFQGTNKKVTENYNTTKLSDNEKRDNNIHTITSETVIKENGSPTKAFIEENVDNNDTYTSVWDKPYIVENGLHSKQMVSFQNTIKEEDLTTAFANQNNNEKSDIMYTAASEKLEEEENGQSTKEIHKENETITTVQNSDEKNHQYHTYSAASDNSFFKENGTSTKGIGIFDGTLKGATITDLFKPIIILHSGRSPKTPKVTIIDGYSVTRNQNGVATITEKSIRFYSNPDKTNPDKTKRLV